MNYLTDANRFGTKMLEKMGWSKGKGLGVNLDGEQNFIRVSHKADQKGIGYQERDDQWTIHANDFNSLLRSLDNSTNVSDAGEENPVNETEPENEYRGFGFNNIDKKVKKLKSIKSKISGKSLEEMSKNSKVRVHYRKFTRGKDISKYSEQDLANIFGKKIESKENGDMNDEQQQENTGENESTSHDYGIPTIQSETTMIDYFKIKKNKLLKRDHENDDDEPLVEDKSQKKRCKKDKKNKTKTNDEIIDVDAMRSKTLKEKKKCKKSKKKTRTNETIILSDENSDCEIIEKQKKKKKKDKTKEKNIKIIDSGSPIESNSTIVDETIETEEIFEKPSKKKKRSTVESEVMASENVESNQNTQFVECILNTLLNVNNSRTNSSTVLAAAAASNSNDDSESDELIQKLEQNSIAMETYEINRYQAEMFRFVDLNGFPNANLSELSGYGYNKNIELKVTAKTQDRSRINDLWDYALINKYGKDVIRTKKKQQYSIRTLKKKNLFKAL